MFRVLLDKDVSKERKRSPLICILECQGVKLQNFAGYFCKSNICNRHGQLYLDQTKTHAIDYNLPHCNL